MSINPHILFIIYVADQDRSRSFYKQLFAVKPSLDVPGMTEFPISETSRLGIMPEDGAARILEGKTPHPSTGNGIPRAELYIRTTDAAEMLERGIRSGGRRISGLVDRDWGEIVGYLSDPDGHIIAVALP